MFHLAAPQGGTDTARWPVPEQRHNHRTHGVHNVGADLTPVEAVSNLDKP